MGLMVLILGKEGKPVTQVSWEAVQAAYLRLLEKSREVNQANHLYSPER